MKKQYVVKVALLIEELENGEWRKHTEIRGVQVGANNKLNATLKAVQFYQDKENVEFVLDRDIVSSEIYSIVRCELVK